MLDEKNVSEEMDGPKAAPEGPDAIDVGALGTLPVIPKEDILEDGEDAEDLDFSAEETPPIRRPNLDEHLWFTPAVKIILYLLVRKVGPNGIETQYFHVSKELRKGISYAMRKVMVIPFYSSRDRRWCLWIAGYNPGNSWTDSLLPYLNRPEDFYKDRKFLVISDTKRGRYDFKSYDDSPLPRPAGRSIEAMLSQALGPKGFITSEDHPVYQLLTSGEPVL